MDDPMDYWHLRDVLSVREAALLVVGCDPSSYDPGEAEKSGYQTVERAITEGLEAEEIRGNAVDPLTRAYADDFYGEMLEPVNLRHLPDPPPDPYESTVEVESLKSFLASRGLHPKFFFPDGKTSAGIPDYLRKNHAQYAPKLAAAVRAWEAVVSESIGSKSPKKRLIEWLKSHAKEYRLNNSSIEEIAKIANWNPKGGAPKTGGK